MKRKQYSNQKIVKSEQKSYNRWNIYQEKKQRYKRNKKLSKRLDKNIKQ